jgi:6-pyruvoyl-tetrahydropterin synthase
MIEKLELDWSGSFSAAHRLPTREGHPCRLVHGHTYAVKVHAAAEGPLLQYVPSEGPAYGMWVDFHAIRDVVMTFDHDNICDPDKAVTNLTFVAEEGGQAASTENLSRFLLEQLWPLFVHGLLGVAGKVPHMAPQIRLQLQVSVSESAHTQVTRSKTHDWDNYEELCALWKSRD